MAKIDLSKRSKAEKLCYDVFSALDPTGVNTKKYRDIFSNMSDTEFVKLMTNMIEDDTLNFVLDVVDFERDADLVKAKKAADILNIPLEEYAIMPFVNGNKDNPTITKEKVFVGYIIEKRLQQTTQKKNGISINIADRSPTTGQVVNHDKNGRSSDQENMALFATGAINAATEFNGFRADGMQRKNQAYSSITQKGYCTLEELDAGIEDRTILNTIDVLYTGMSIKTDLVNNDYMLIDTMKKIKQKTAATKESVEVDDDYRTVTESIRVVPKNTIPNDILKLHTKLNSYSYGVLKRGRITNDVTPQEWNKLYRLLIPEEVDKYKGGCCWDFVAYQYDKLTKLGYKVTNYFIITDTPPAYDTHTISVIETDKGLLYIESAFKEIMGVYYVTSLPELFEYIVSHMWNSNDNQLRFDKIKYDVRKFDSCILYGATCDEYMNYMTTKTQIVYQGESINPSGRTADQLYDPPYNPDQIKDKYGIVMYNKLMKDDAHKFRALSGIELIHKEPSIDEFNRIWHNWNNMTDEMKAESDKESIRLFGVDNTTHYKQLLPEYGVTESLLLSQFSKVPTTKQNIDKYKTDAKFLSHMTPYEQGGAGYIYIDKGKVVLCINTIRHGDELWVQGIEISKDYQKQGLSKQALNVIINDIGKNDSTIYLSVSKSNKLAYDIYKSIGFKEFKYQKSTSDKMIFMKYQKSNGVTEGILSKTPSMLVNKKDIQLNLDKWGTAPEYNVLFITGFSGSGKSTLSKEYAGPNVHVFELDAYTANTQPIPKDEFYNYMVSNVPDINMLLDVKKTGELLPTYKYSQILVNVIGAMLQFAEMNYPKKKFIIEGIQLYRDVPTDYVYGRPLIIKGTSGINSIVNRLKRDGDKYEYKSIFDYLNWYTLDTKRMNILYDEITTEGMLDDIVNGVNPYSNKLFFHVSKDSKLNGKTLKPRIPSWITESIKKHGKKKFDDMMKFNGLYEDYTIPRVCFSSSIEGSINAMIPGSSIITAAKDGALSGVYYVYIPEKPINEYKHIKNKDVVDNGYVYDANITREMWVLEPVKLKLYGVIQVESVGNVKPVKNDNLTKKLDKPIYNYKNDIKWKWKIHPTVIDKYYSLNLYNQ